MAVFKCKMCGGDLNIEQGVSVCECDYCGTKQTVPSADNEKKLTLFTRANRLRFNSEFDKAAGVYESIVADFPEEAEAYWGLVLCKYGIEYVDDPATAKKIPTCHRSSFDSVMDDSNFELVMEYADPIARGVYREEAKQIEELRKSIIEVSSKEEPYDIFICYKETAEDGNRTLDSVIAQDVYDALTEKGYRVFFSRITLEDKLGKEYEPYIFAALNSAKVMLAFGTSYDHYNAVWVKNEWSRFLQLIAKGEKKTLIPCYKGIDAYDMPKEFAKLQAQDMGKVGAIQDLLRGIEKVLPKNNPVKETVVIQQSASNPTTESLLKRAFMALEDGEWDKADGFCEQVLNASPECAEAYLGKLMAEFRVRKISELSNVSKPMSLSKNYRKFILYSKSDLKTNPEVIEAIYRNAKKEASRRKYCYAVNMLNSISEYKDSGELIKEYNRKTEVFRTIKNVALILIVILCFSISMYYPIEMFAKYELFNSQTGNTMFVIRNVIIFISIVSMGIYLWFKRIWNLILFFICGIISEVMLCMIPIGNVWNVEGAYGVKMGFQCGVFVTVPGLVIALIIYIVKYRFKSETGSHSIVFNTITIFMFVGIGVVDYIIYHEGMSLCPENYELIKTAFDLLVILPYFAIAFADNRSEIKMKTGDCLRLDKL